LKTLPQKNAYILLSWNTSPDPETEISIALRDITFEREQQESVVQTKNELTAILNASEFSIMQLTVMEQ
jgi:hypothetical protein